MILVDTGALVAALDSSDSHHKTVSGVNIAGLGRMVTSDACITEAMYLLHKSIGWSGIKQLQNLVEINAVEIFPLTPEHRKSAFKYMDRFRDQPCDYADATLLALAESTGVRQVFTIDKHFYAYRLSSGEPLEVI